MEAPPTDHSVVATSIEEVGGEEKEEEVIQQTYNVGEGEVSPRNNNLEEMEVRFAQLALDLNNQFRALKAEQEDLRLEKSRMKGMHKLMGDKIRLNVGGKIFVTSKSTLIKDQKSMLAAMFSGRYELEQDPHDHTYFIDRDGKFFRYILNYLRDGSVELPQDDEYLLRNLLREAEFFGIDGFRDLVCQALASLIDRKQLKEGNDKPPPIYSAWYLYPYGHRTSFPATGQWTLSATMNEKISGAIVDPFCFKNVQNNMMDPINDKIAEGYQLHSITPFEFKRPGVWVVVLTHPAVPPASSPSSLSPSSLLSSSVSNSLSHQHHQHGGGGGTQGRGGGAGGGGGGPHHAGYGGIAYNAPPPGWMSSPFNSHFWNPSRGGGGSGGT